MRKLFVTSAMAILFALLGSLISAPAYAHGDHHKGKIKICKIVKKNDSDKKFLFLIDRLSSRHGDTWVRVEAGDCKTLTVKTGRYKVTEAKKRNWELKAIFGEGIVDKDVDERWAKVHVKKHDKDTIVFVNKKKDNDKDKH